MDFAFTVGGCDAEAAAFFIGGIGIADMIGEVAFDDEDAAVADGSVKGERVGEFYFFIDCSREVARFSCSKCASCSAGDEAHFFCDG